MRASEDNAATDLLAWRLRDLAGSAAYGRRCQRIRVLVEAGELRESVGNVLERIMLVEMLARPGHVRVVERLASALLPRRTLTMGPMQLRGAPLWFESAVRSAADRLDDCPLTPVAVARRWNGSSATPAGALVSYPIALVLADRALAADGRALIWSSDADTSVLVDSGP